MEQPNKFLCPDGHEFEAKRQFRAFCPRCGKSARRVYEGNETPSDPNTNDDDVREEQSESNTGEHQPKGEETEDKSEDKKPERKFRARRVVVKRSDKKDNKRTSDKKPTRTSNPPSKVTKGSIVGRRRSEAGPRVSKRVVTNKEKADKKASQGAGEFSTTWQRIKRISGF